MHKKKENFAMTLLDLNKSLNSKHNIKNRCNR